MKVLSLFDGISCARVALERAGIKVDSYLASEIDTYAVAISRKNYPDIVRLGDVRGVINFKENPDLLIGGSPCQDLSSANTNRKGLAGARSGLFYEYLRILKETQPKYFILENVASMSKEARATITAELGVEPIMINAALVSAQSRKRLFWTNIADVTQPEDKGILLRDILQSGVTPDKKSYAITATQGRKNARDYFTKRHGQMVFEGNERIAGLSMNKGTLRAYQRNKKKSTAGEHVYNTLDSKAATLSTAHRAKIVGTEVDEKYFVDIEDTGAGAAQSGRIYSPDGKSVPLQAGGGGRGAKTGLYVVPYTDLATGITYDRVRKLTPIECERLQCLPDNYTQGVSNSQRYKALGNGFNVDVVAHILSFIN